MSEQKLSPAESRLLLEGLSTEVADAYSLELIVEFNQHLKLIWAESPDLPRGLVFESWVIQKLAELRLAVLYHQHQFHTAPDGST